MQHFGEMTQLPEIPGAKRHCSVIAGYDRQSGSPVKPGMTVRSGMTVKSGMTVRSGMT